MDVFSCQLFGMKKVVVFIGWFQALNGIIKYYPNWQTGRLQQSRYLQIYSILHSLVMICGVPLLFIDSLSDNPVIVKRMNSHWIHNGALLYVMIHSLVVLSTIYCVHFLQHRIQQMIIELQSLDHFELSTADQRYIYSLLYRKVFLVCFQIVTLFGLNFLRFQTSIQPFQLLYILYKAWSDIHGSAISLLIYEILWKICYCGYGIQFQLRQILTRRVQLKELFKLFKKQQALIDVRNEFCGTFQHLMFWYPIRILCTGVLSVYVMIRIHVGEPKAILVIFIIMTFVIYSLAEFHILNDLATVVADLIPDAIAVLRESQPQHHQVERAISWMTLQLSCQSTEIHIFGMVTLIQRLSFFLMTEIILNTLYMLQSDYYFFM